MTGDIYVYGEIGTGPGQVSLKSVKSQIDKSAEKYVVHIFSPGGDVFEGYGIYNAIKNDTNGKNVEVHIEGLCASIATLIAASGDRIVMNKTGQFMIHNPHISDLKGDAGKLRSVADQLDQIKSILINAYKSRTGLTDEKLWELYDNETYLTADQAVAMGFVDESVDAIKAVASLNLNNFKMENTLIGRLKNLFSLTKFKNEFTEQLASGQVIIVMSDDEDWTGKQVVLEDGSPLPAGDHALASGKVISVDEAGLITQVTTAETAKAEPAENNTEMDNKIKELETALAEAKAAKETAEAAANAAKTEATQATAKAAKFENRVQAIESQFLKMQEQMGQTVGDRSEPGKGPTFKGQEKNKPADPMGEFALKFYKNNNMIRNEEA